MKFISLEDYRGPVVDELKNKFLILSGQVAIKEPTLSLAAIAERGSCIIKMTLEDARALALHLLRISDGDESTRQLSPNAVVIGR